MTPNGMAVASPAVVEMPPTVSVAPPPVADPDMEKVASAPFWRPVTVITPAAFEAKTRFEIPTFALMASTSAAAAVVTLVAVVASSVTEVVTRDPASSPMLMVKMFVFAGVPAMVMGWIWAALPPTCNAVSS